MKKYTMNEMVHLTKNMLNERGVAIEDIALIVQKLQEKYHPDLPLDVCIENVEKVLNKREIVPSYFFAALRLVPDGFAAFAAGFL